MKSKKVDSILIFTSVLLLIHSLYQAYLANIRSGSGFLGGLGNAVVAAISLGICLIIILIFFIRRVLSKRDCAELEIRFTKVLVITFTMIVLSVFFINSIRIFRLNNSEVILEREQVQVYKGEGTTSGKILIRFKDKTNNIKKFIVDKSYLEKGKLYYENIYYVFSNGQYIESFIDEKEAKEFVEKSKREKFVYLSYSAILILFIIFVGLLVNKNRKSN